MRIEDFYRQVVAVGPAAILLTPDDMRSLEQQAAALTVPGADDVREHLRERTFAGFALVEAPVERSCFVKTDLTVHVL